METLTITATDDTPEVHLDVQSGTFFIGGRSLPENVAKFYIPLLNWLEAYSKSPNGKTEFSFFMTYINSASSKMLSEVFAKLEKIHNETQGVTVNWKYKEEDDDMLETGEDLEDLFKVPFKYLPQHK